MTLKGIKYIRAADVIIYDHLTPKEVLSYSKSSCKMIYLNNDNEEIDILRKYSLKGKLVVRLKNGDPYIFGRGGKICLTLTEEGIECEVIPGVSSVNSVPAYAGIPLTFPKISDMITIVSGITEGGKLFDFQKIPEKGTLIVLMAGKRLEEISKGLISKRSPSEEVAIIERGTYIDQRVSLVKLRELSELNLSSPSMLVIGDVIKLRNFLWKLS
ncbi:uroporphyrin-III methyltransferase [Sulfolobus sp. S-194]|nr:uroporphyrin-III methyltransferase [Sulfolobus sp. S-194]